MKYSFVVAFKNREEKRVKNFLDSLQEQSFIDFELVFINQGSDEDVTTWLEALIKEYTFISYIHNRTDGHLWNKSNALNIGIKAAKGEFVIIADIDVIFTYDYLNKINELISPGYFITHDAIYLPQGYKLTPVKKEYEFASYFIGVCVARRKSFIDINGYDEYYIVWGAEDDDIINRLEASGEKRLHIKADQVQLFHQWHQTNTPKTTDFWYLDIIQRLYIKNVKVPVEMWGESTYESDRVIYKYLNDNTALTNFTRLNLISHPTFQFNQFYFSFNNLKRDQVAIFEYEEPVDHSTKTKLAALVILFNNFLKWKKYKYKLFVRPENEYYLQSVAFVDSFIKYFIGKNRQHIADYYYKIEGRKVYLLLIKK